VGVTELAAASWNKDWKSQKLLCTGSDNSVAHVPLLPCYGAKGLH